MEPIYVKEALSHLDRVHLFALQNEGDGSLQHAIEGVINIVEGITIRSKKQTSILIFFQHYFFFNMFRLNWSSRVKSVLILNVPYFVTLTFQKMSTYFDRAKLKN